MREKVVNVEDLNGIIEETDILLIGCGVQLREGIKRRFK